MTRQKVPDEVRRRRAVALAGHEGDEASARRGLVDPVADVRATALSALARMGCLTPTEVAASLADVSPVVRRRACEVAIGCAEDGVVAGLVDALADHDEWVTVAAGFALGELGPSAGPVALSRLAEVAASHADPLCREAAVAALGAIGDPAAIPTIVAATHDRPSVRRRAVLALAPFTGPEVEAALRDALSDRDWQVRQAAEDLLGDA